MVDHGRRLLRLGFEQILIEHHHPAALRPQLRGCPREIFRDHDRLTSRRMQGGGTLGGLLAGRHQKNHEDAVATFRPNAIR